MLRLLRSLSLVCALCLIGESAYASPNASEAAYIKVRDHVRAFRKDAKAQQYRENYAQLIGELKAYRDKYPSSARYDDCLYIIADLRRELYQVSNNKADARRSADTFLAMATRHKRSTLADDAALHAAKLYRDVLKDTEGEQDVYRAYQSLPKGDKHARLEAFFSGRNEAQEDGTRHVAVVPSAPNDAPTKKEPFHISKMEHKKKKVAQNRKLNDVIDMAVGQKTSKDHTHASGASVHHPKEKNRPDSVTTNDGVSVADIKKEIGKVDGAAVTISEQMGLKVKKIMIDPGHGGHDTGAVGQGGTLEKHVVMRIAKKVVEQLETHLPGVEVKLTRTTDEFISLKDRTQMANAWGADLFLSIHANANPDEHVHGIETYYLNVTDDKYAKRLAARENQESGEDGISDLDFILADLATKSNVDDSVRLGKFVQQHTVSHLKQGFTKVNNLGLKKALFYVLIGTRMPSVLVETSFLSNSREEKRLKSTKYQKSLADGIVKGVLAYVESRKTAYTALK